jgi:hypothetical protein
MLKIYIFLFTHLSAMAFCQRTNNFIGKVVDEDNYGIPFVTIFINSKYINSDENGIFKISDLLESDSLTSNSTGFQQIKISATDFLKTNKIVLKRKLIHLAELKIINKSSKWIGYTNELDQITTYNFLSLQSSETGIIIGNKEKNRGIIKSIKVKVGFIGKPKLPYRIHLYSLQKNGIPENELLQREIVFKPRSKKLKWYTFNIEEQNIELPETGLAATIEFINPSTKNYILSKNFTPIRQGFFSRDFQVISRHSNSNGWYLENSSLPMISLEVLLQ